MLSVALAVTRTFRSVSLAPWHVLHPYTGTLAHVTYVAYLRCLPTLLPALLTNVASYGARLRPFLRPVPALLITCWRCG